VKGSLRDRQKMREIDFLPDWYRSGRRRQVAYYAQYLVLAGVLVVMTMWSLGTAYLVLRVTRELAAARPRQQEAQLRSQEFDKIQSQVAKLQKRADIISSVDSRINVANVLAELSFLIDEKVVLSKVQITSEKFVEDEGATGRGAAVTVASDKSGRGAPAGDWSGDVKFKVVIGGMAVDAGCVADLICRLENSPYFCLVYPSFSRNGQIKAQKGKPAAAGGDWQSPESYQVSEFEISCYLANYRQEADLPARQDKGPGRGTAQPQSPKGGI
jgi:Tfp pilus assembly protein PilN